MGVSCRVEGHSSALMSSPLLKARRTDETEREGEHHVHTVNNCQFQAVSQALFWGPEILQLDKPKQTSPQEPRKFIEHENGAQPFLLQSWAKLPLPELGIMNALANNNKLFTFIKHLLCPRCYSKCFTGVKPGALVL